MLVSAVRLTAFSVVIDTKLSGVQGCLLLSLLLSQQQKRPGCWRNGLTSSSLPTPLFLVTFSPMMLHSKRSVNQWRSLSFKGKRKYKHAPYTTFNTSATWICSFIPNASHFQGPRNLKSSCLLVCEWHPLLLCLLQVSPALPSEEGSPQRPSPPGHHENTVSKNRGLLPSFQLFRSSRYLHFHSHYWMEGTLADPPPADMKWSCTLLRSAVDVFFFSWSIAGRLRSRLVKSSQG